jgi:hypothetical protein
MGWMYMISGITDCKFVGGPMDGENWPMQFKDKEGKARWLELGERFIIEREGSLHIYDYERNEFDTAVFQHKGIKGTVETPAIHPKSPLGLFLSMTQETDRPEPRNGY